LSTGEEGERPRGPERPLPRNLDEEELKEGLRQLLSDADSLSGTLELLSPYARELVEAVASGAITEEEFLREVFVGDCPSCEGRSTTDCDDVAGILDVTVGLCRDCGYTWCLECGAATPPGGPCGHWEVCGECTEERDEFGECGIPLFDCPAVIDRTAAGPGASLCAWCGVHTGGADVFAIGAMMEKEFEFDGPTEEGCPMVPVAVAGRIVPAVVTAPGSRARLDGYDVMFVTCSEECAVALRGALSEERDRNDRNSLN